MTRKQLVALSILAALAGNAALSQEATPAPRLGDGHSSALRLGATLPSTKERAELLADLQVWRESGLADLDRDRNVDVNSDAYKQASARYAELRSSSRYHELVQQYLRLRGGSTLLVGR